MKTPMNKLFTIALLCTVAVVCCVSCKQSASESLETTQAVQPPPADAGTVRGTVVNQDGQPLSDVAITIETSKENSVACTNAAGEFTVTLGSAPDRWLIAKPRAKGWQLAPNQPQGAPIPAQPESLLWSQFPADSAHLAMNIRMISLPVLDGQIYLSDRVTPAPAAKVMMFRRDNIGNPCEWDSAKTVADGMFHFNIPQVGTVQDVCIIAWDTGRKEAGELFFSVTSPEDWTNSHTLYLTPEMPLKGVIMSSGGNPIADASLQMFYTSELCGISMDTSENKSNSRGEFLTYAKPDASIGIRLRTKNGQTVSTRLDSNDWRNRTATFIYDDMQKELNATFDAPAIP